MPLQHAGRAGFKPTSRTPVNSEGSSPAGPTSAPHLRVSHQNMSKLCIIVWVVVILSEPTIAQQNNPYACLGEAGGVVSLKLTDRSLEKLKSDGISGDTLRDLEAMKGKEFIEEGVFLLALRSASRGERDAKFESLVLESAARERGVRVIHQAIKNRLDALARNHDALDYCVIAELMKRVGDYRAPKYYVKAIVTDVNEPAYDFFLAEYWRNFRGAQHPVFPKAEEHYFQALRKLDKAGNSALRKTTAAQIERGLIALYQEDGVPLAHYGQDSVEQPFLFLTTIFNAAHNTSDFDQRSEVRDFTSESLFSRSSQRLNRSLTEDELRRIIRVKGQFETLNRLRFRYKGGPGVDFTYKYRDINRAQITNFFEPNKFNDVNLSEYGVSVEKPLDARAFDVFLRGSFKRARRVGTIEFLSRTKEEINQVEANAVVSRFVGPDKANFEVTYVHQDIQENRANPLKRARSIYAEKFTYQLFRPVLQRVYRSRFETRGIDLFGGAVHDKETFGVVDVIKNDYFFGASLKGFKRFDFTVQPTIFTSAVGNDATQKNSQFRTNVSALFRILDEERQPKDPDNAQSGNPAFLHLVIPFSRDVALTGPNSFENYKIGAGLNAKLFTSGNHRTTFLASVRYDYQNFHRLRRGVNLFSLNFSMGF